MAEASISVSPEQFCCPVCLDLLKEPVAFPCGHSYCMVCITDCWNQDDEKGVYSCPQCRQAFTPRPVLSKNNILAEMVEKLGKTTLQTAAPAQYAGPKDVECSVCTGRKRKALKSCLMCMNSYCHIHLEQHENFFKDKKHHLMEATERLQQMICKTHDRPLEVFCQTDYECICMMCLLDKHKNHKTRTAAAERMDKQRQLEEERRECSEKIQQTEKKLQELRKAVESHKRSAQAAVDNIERIFTELICSIERRRSEVTQLIRAQEKAEVSEAEMLMETLESEIDCLRRTDAEIEQLSHTEDHIHFLQTFGLTIFFYTPNHTVSSQLSFDNIGNSVSLLKRKLEDFCKEEMKRICARVKYIQITATDNPMTREEFLQSSCQLSLDPNTANTHLCLSQENTAVTYTGKEQLCFEHPDRFIVSPQVLCRESVCGRAYWEVEWSGNCWVGIAVSYKNIDRKGEFGHNDQSWTLRNTILDLFFTHNSVHSKIIAPLQSSRIGVYVDHSAGTLSFYSVSDTMTLLKKVKTTFTQPLYPGFMVLKGSSVKLCDLTT